MPAYVDQPVQSVTVKISKASLAQAAMGKDTAKLLREQFETRRSAIQRFTERLKKTLCVPEPAWTAALRELGIADSEIEALVSQARRG